MRRELAAIVLTIPALTIAALTVGASRAVAQVPPPAGSTVHLPASTLSAPDRARVLETLRVSRQVGDSLWRGWNEMPLALLIITPESEVLIGHPRPSRDFSPAGSDAVLGPILRRRRVFPVHLLASFPAVSGVPTVVVGRPEATGKTATRWVLSLLHERFHQLQMGQPGYFDGVAALGLARGDTTGNWMLSYPFPYEDPAVRGAFVDLASHLLRALELAGTGDFAERLEAYHRARTRLYEALSEDDYRYFQLQLWQEGVARYTELRIAEIAYPEEAIHLRREIMDGLQTARLADQRRVAFYPLGAATALLLDRVSPGWRTRYFEDPFALDPYFDGE